MPPWTGSQPYRSMYESTRPASHSQRALPVARYASRYDTPHQPASSKYALPLYLSPHCHEMPPVPLMVGSQKFSPALNVELTRALFAGVGSAIATAATSSIIGYDAHMVV